MISLLLAAACAVTLAGAVAVAWDLHSGLSGGTFHLVRHPVSRESGGRYVAVAVMEALALLVCIGVAVLEMRLFLVFRKRPAGEHA
jgi:hypothetical protein